MKLQTFKRKYMNKRLNNGYTVVRVNVLAKGIAVVLYEATGNGKYHTWEYTNLNYAHRSLKMKLKKGK